MSLAAFLVAGLVLTVVAIVWAWMVEPKMLRSHHLSFGFDRWPEGYGLLRIVFITDLHVGCPSVDLNRVSEIVDRANSVQPDLILLGGDHMGHRVLGGRVVPPEHIARELGRLQARRGVFSVLGNHDWWFDGTRIRSALEAAGICVLENEARLVGDGPGFWLLGLADESMRRPDPAGALAQITDDRPVLALAHDPASFTRLGDRPLLTLCGHTHGGQVRIPFIGPIRNASTAPLRWSYGHIVDQGRHMFVSTGIGTSVLPIRFNAPPEIVIIDIRNENVAEAETLGNATGSSPGRSRCCSSTP